jgi:hypothetical protein
LGLGPRKALGVIYLTTTAIAILGVLIGFAPPEVVVAATMMGIGIVVALVALGVYWLEYHEFLDAGASLAHAIRKSRSVIQDKINARDLAALLRDARSIEEVQALLRDHAETFRFAHMKLSDPFRRKQAAGRLTQELQTLKLWKLEYPILQRASDEYDGCVLQSGPRSRTDNARREPSELRECWHLRSPNGWARPNESRRKDPASQRGIVTGVCTRRITPSGSEVLSSVISGCSSSKWEARQHLGGLTPSRALRPQYRRSRRFVGQRG